MWYGIIRIILGLFLGILTYFVIRKKIKRRIIIFILPIMIVIFSCYALFCIPIENAFLEFSSPEKAFHYLYTGDVKSTIDGESSTMVLYTNNNASSWAIIPKSGNGWKLDVLQSNKDILSKTVDRYIINVFNARNTEDYYVTIWDTFTKDIIDITDSKGSKFQYIEEENKGTSDKNVKYFTYVKGLEDGYSITIGNETYVLFNKADK